MFITFEGPEGAGKTTAIAALADRLQRAGHQVIRTREPGAGDLGKKIRSILLEEDELDGKTELLLFLADRANHVQSVIRPALAEGKIVLCDRFTDSTLVYQGYAMGMDRDFIRTANDFATGGLSPDTTLLFDLPPEAGLARLQSMDRLDRKPLDFHQRVRAGFLREAHAEPRRWVLIDATRSAEQVLEDVVGVMMNRLGETGS
jgi:dTMP kinase